MHNRFRMTIAAAIVAAASLTGCGATLTQLRTRAAVDLACAPEGIRTDAIDGATEMATGCGRRAIYVQLFNNSRYPTWLLNSSVQPVGGSALPQAMR